MTIHFPRSQTELLELYRHIFGSDIESSRTRFTAFEQVAGETFNVRLNVGGRVGRR